MDGWRYLIGLKIVGIKIKMPLNVITPEDSITTDLVKDAKTELRSTFTVLSVFLLGSYLFHWQTQRHEQKKINHWKANNLALIKQQITEQLLLIKDKADRNQAEIIQKVVIWRALYGQKSEIKRYIARFQDNRANLVNLYRKRTQSVEPNEPFCVADVTIACQFGLDPNINGLLFPRM